MRTIFLALDRCIQALTAAAAYISGICIAVIAIIVCYEIAMRGLFNAPTEWSIEISGYLVIVSGFLGFASALAHDKHICVDLLTAKLPEKLRIPLGMTVSVVGLFFSYVLFIEGLDMTITSYEMMRTSTSTLRIPLYIPHASVPIGALLLLLQFVRKIIYAWISIRRPGVGQGGHS